MNQKYIVMLGEAERKQLFETVDAQDTPKTIRKRCNILLLADTCVGKAPAQVEIASRCGVSDVCVYQTVKDYLGFDL